MRQRWILILVMAGLMAWPLLVGPTAAQQMGIFFDEEGTSCTEILAPFNFVKAHILIIGDPGTTISGAIFNFTPPVDMNIRPEPAPVWARNATPFGEIVSTAGVDVIIQPCATIDNSGIFTLLTFDLEDVSSGANPRPDLILELGGGIVRIDTLTLDRPNLKICNPANPDSSLALVPVDQLRATLNCSGNCPCTTGVRQETWATIKRLYLEMD